MAARPRGRAVVAALVAGLLGGMVGTVAPGAAQTPPDTIRLDTLVVEVLRTELMTEAVPYALSVATERELREGTSGLFLDEAFRSLTGLRVQNRFNFAVGERLSVRGFGARAQFGIRDLAVVVDGIPATLPDGQASLDHLDLGSLGRAELLRGPASALYGNGAGGLLRLETAPPPTFPAVGSIEFVDGSHGLSRVQASISGTVGPTGYLVDVNRLGWDGFRDNPAAEGSEPYGGAERLHFNARVRHPLGPGILVATLNGVDLDSENPGSLAIDAIEAGSREAFSGSVNQRTGKEVQQVQAGASWRGPVTGTTDLDLALFAGTRDLRNPIPPAIVDLERVHFGGHAFLSWSGWGGVAGRDLTVGLELQRQNDDRLNFENDGGEEGAATLDQDERIWSAGAFVRVGTPLSPTVRLEGALRYDRVRFEVDDDFLVGGDPDDSGSRTMDALSPTVGVIWTPSERDHFFANFSTTFSTPTSTELANRPEGAGGFNPDLDPVRGRSFEFGGRRVLAPWLRGEVAFYRTDLEDELISFEVPEAPGRSFFRNAGSSHHQGFELALDADLPLRFGGSFRWTLVDTELEEYTVEGEDLSGKRIPGVAPHRVEGGLRWDDGLHFLELRGEWNDRIPVDDRNSGFAADYALFDLRFEVREVNFFTLRVSPFVGITNLLDESYVSAVAVNAFGGRFFEPGPGRSNYLGARVSWPPVPR